jgi:DNA-binding transcriptional LysR family regulator
MSSSKTPPKPSLHTDLALSVNSLEAVVAVAATGSMSAAAKRLACSQSSVSQLVSQAEALLGCKLFHRESRPFRTTAEGGELTHQAARILRDLNALPQLVAARRERPTLRVAMVDSIADTIGPDLVRFAAEHAGDLFVSQGLTPAHINDLQERRVDLVVSGDALEEYDGLSRFPLMSEKFVLLLPEKNRRNASCDTLADLAEELPFIRYSSRSRTSAIIERYLRMAHVPDGRRIEVDNASMMFSLVASQVGWAITTPLHLLQGMTRLNGIIVSKIPNPTPERQVTLVTREGEWQLIAELLAAETRRLLIEKFLPQLIAEMPFLKTEITVAAQ